MVGDNAQYVEAVVEKDGKIAFTGSLCDAKELFPAATEMDLQGKCMMPGHIDPHRLTSSPVHGGLDSADAFYHTVRLVTSKRQIRGSEDPRWLSSTSQ